MILFTADEHYEHKNILKYQRRPFDSVASMNKELIAINNSIVSANDTVYHIGDFSFCNPDIILKDLIGKHILITGSHDHKQGTLWHRVYHYVCEIVVEGQPIVLTHYAQRRWPRSHYGSWNLYGHSHNGLPNYGYSFDVGVDTNNYQPYSFNQVRERMAQIKVTEYPIYSNRGERT